MIKFPARSPNSCIDTGRQSSRERGGRFSRKPQIGSFIKKGQESVLLTESISAVKASPRQKCRTQMQFFNPQMSLKHLNGIVGQEIKFLSPKNDKESRISSSNQNIQSQKSPRFTRKSQWQQKKVMETSISNKINDNNSETNFTPKISQISLESVVHKQNESTVPNTQDWSTLERENIQLRQENKKLKDQNAKYLRKMKALIEQEQVKSQQKSTKCQNCATMEEQIKLQGKYLKLFQSTITSKQKELQNMKSQLMEARLDIDKERSKYLQSKERLKEMTQKFHDEEQKNGQLERIILSLKKKFENSQQQKRSLGIQQNILLKKNQESQQWKIQVAKLTTQKQNLKEQITTYKTRLDIIQTIKNKKKISKMKSSKELDHSDFFDLSSEQSDCN